MKNPIFVLAAFCVLTVMGACAADRDGAAPARAGEITTDSGLKYLDQAVGQGDEAMEGSAVEVHYTGWLYENGQRGSQFDSSVGGPPFMLTIGQTPVIKGWTEGLVGMKVGGKRELIIPPDLAYGAKSFPGEKPGDPPLIPANATLDFEVELLKVAK